MLNPDEIDADFFTPSSSTTLACLFKKTAAPMEEEKDNASLKYIPQLPPIDLTKSEDSKQTQCIFACSLQAYEWLNNTYILRGKLGFAIIKHLKSGIHNIVLYDSKKTTLSNVTITPNFEINVKKSVSIAYYDNLRKYWSVYASEGELHKILQVLHNLGVNTKFSIDTEKQPEISNLSIKREESSSTDKDETSNTDSTKNRKTKKSILSRISNMGQSVLPNPIAVTKSASESSDSNKNYDMKIRRSKHKQLKTLSSRNNTENMISKNNADFSDESKISQQNFICQSRDFDNNQSNQIIAFTTSPVIKDVRSDLKSIANINDVSLLISEQRVSNSEIRINLNKVTDKLDVVLDKLKDGTKIESNSNSLQFQNVLVQKLLMEYEIKIKIYEDFITQKGYTCNKLFDDKVKQNDELQNDKYEEATKLQNELGKLTKQYESSIERENEYKNQIRQLETGLLLKNDEIVNLNKKLDNTSDNFQKSDDAKNKIKSIMNDTYQSISTRFSDTDNYSGANVKNIVAKVIKKTTIEAISDM